MIRQNKKKLLKTSSRPGHKCILLGWVFLSLMELADLAKKIPVYENISNLCDLNFIDTNITCIVVIAVVQCFVVVKNEGIS